MLSTLPISHARTHGQSYTTTYRSWTHMKNRCLNPNDDRWEQYGGCGIKLHEPWRIFANFHIDMGDRPPGTSLDRWPNPNGNYEPTNCRWATRSEQQNNRRDNGRIAWRGKVWSIPQLVQQSGLSRRTLQSRLDRGWSIERAMKPVQSVRDIPDKKAKDSNG